MHDANQDCSTHEANRLPVLTASLCWTGWPVHCLQVVARLHPATIVFNSGLWRSPGGENWPAEVYEAIMGAAVDAVRPQGGTCIWKTTTFALDGRIPRTWDDPALQHAAAHGLGVMDAWALTRAAAALDPPPWVDDLHFLGYVYQELNRFLLNMIC